MLIIQSDLEKGRKALPAGTEKTWQGKVYIKKGDGTWVPKGGAGAKEKTQKEESSKANIDTKGSDAHLKRGAIKGERLIFNTPYKGTTGASLIGYEWPHHVEEDIGKYGQEIFRKISHWDEADISKMTGRKFVHKFVINTTDGKVETLSAESAAVVLGISEASMRNRAKSMLGKHIEEQKMQEKASKDADTIEFGKWSNTPYDALMNDEAFGQTWLKYQSWGMKKYAHHTDADLRYNADRNFVPMLINNKGEYQFGSVTGLKLVELEKRGIKEVKVAVSDIWDKDGNIKDIKLEKGRKGAAIGEIREFASMPGKKFKKVADGWEQVGGTGKRGRPAKDNKNNINNKNNIKADNPKADTAADNSVSDDKQVDKPVADVVTTPVSRGRGRPKGSKNTPKQAPVAPAEPKTLRSTFGLRQMDSGAFEALRNGTMRRDRMSYGQKVMYQGDYAANKRYKGRQGTLVAIGDHGYAVLEVDGKTFTAAWRDIKSVGGIKAYSMYDGLDPANVYETGGLFEIKLNKTMEQRIGTSAFTYNGLAKEFKKYGFTLNIVGGTVRDILGDKGEVKDIDFIFDGSDRELYATLEKINPKWVKGAKTNGHLGLVSFTDGTDTVDITPIHKFSHETKDMAKGWTLKDDAVARDIVMNTLQVDSLTGVLVDATGKGLDDIENNEIHFADDSLLKHAPTYLLRSFKFISRGYKMSDETKKTLKDNLHYISTLPPRRITDFLNNQIGSKDGEKGLLKFKDLLYGMDSNLWDKHFESIYQNVMPRYRGK